MKTKRLPKWIWIWIPIAGLAVLYWTWCWGYWGRGNLLMQAVFQCRCPGISEQARYRPFKMLASACAEPYLLGFSPTGRYVILSEQYPERRATRLDLMTGETIDIGFGKGYPFLLTENPLFTAVNYPQARYFLVDLTDKVETEVTPAESLEAAIIKLREADKVWVTNDQLVSYPYVIGMVNDYKHNTQGNVAFIWQGKKQELYDTLNEGGIKYDFISPPYEREVGLDYYYFYSLNGQRFRADANGIYLAQTNQLIAPTNTLYGVMGVAPIGWVLDSHAVIYGGGGYRYLIDNRSYSPFGSTSFPVPQPILLLEVPPQYWATPTPVP